ncbi:hypothetical protein CDAR_550311 [Caerostris darwini]|uniref:Uncharacterized protein n=1 Tax=Caerostris darwini TaxID=1538125 RepID=A0AAV4XAM8_9ARAC|nr:hypothetical protein CDAR_550311 [Caerostris darwini]
MSLPPTLNKLRVELLYYGSSIREDESDTPVSQTGDKMKPKRVQGDKSSGVGRPNTVISNRPQSVNLFQGAIISKEEEDFQLSRSETDNGRTWAQLCRALTQACIIQQVPATKSKIENPLGRDRRKDAFEEKDYPEIIRFNGTPTSGDQFGMEVSVWVSGPSGNLTRI